MHGENNGRGRFWAWGREQGEARGRSRGDARPSGQLNIKFVNIGSVKAMQVNVKVRGVDEDMGRVGEGKGDGL